MPFFYPLQQRALKSPMIIEHYLYGSKVHQNLSVSIQTHQDFDKCRLKIFLHFANESLELTNYLKCQCHRV